MCVTIARLVIIESVLAKSHTHPFIEKADSLRPEAVWIENNVCAILQHLEDCQLGAPRLRNPCKLAFEKLVLWDWLENVYQFKNYTLHLTILK